MIDVAISPQGYFVVNGDSRLLGPFASKTEAELHRLQLEGWIADTYMGTDSREYRCGGGAGLSVGSGAGVRKAACR